jgi:hypothetical protein
VTGLTGEKGNIENVSGIEYTKAARFYSHRPFKFTVNLKYAIVTTCKYLQARFNL